MTRPKRTVIFWGAGATAALGIRTTADQTSALRALALEQGSLNQRIGCALQHGVQEPWTPALRDLLTILGDVRSSQEEVPAVAITRQQLDVMRRNSAPGASEDVLRDCITSLRTLYDWPALKAVIGVCPGVKNATGKESTFQLNDLFNVLDMHGQSGHGFRDKHDNFLTPQRVLGARNALKMLLQALFYIDWQCSREHNRSELEHHYDFAKTLGRRMQREGLELSSNSFESRHFYMGDVSFVSMNYDPVALWCQFVANRELNESPNVPHVGSPASKLQIFHDLGHFVAGSRVEEKKGLEGTPWHPMNEASAQRLNDRDHRSEHRIRITKFLFPHGCLWWRECPNCGKLSSYMGDEWETDSPTLIPPPPLKAFMHDVKYRHRSEDERNAWAKGEVDARTCVHCPTLTYAHHTQTVMQSSFKSRPPPFLDEIKRDLRVAVQDAKHIVLMGYSLPPDDVDYRAFFAARRPRPVKCSVVDLVDKGHAARWYGAEAWPSLLAKMDMGKPPRTTLEAARDLFGEKNVRFYSGGIPNVFLDGGRVTDAAVSKLLKWEST